MTTYEFFKQLEEWHYQFRFSMLNDDEIFILDATDKWLLAKVSKAEPYVFEFTVSMHEVFTAESQEADALMRLVASYSRTDPSEREDEWINVWEEDK